MSKFYLYFLVSLLVSLGIIFMDGRNVRNVDVYELSPKRQKINVFNLLPTFCIFLIFLFVLVYHFVIQESYVLKYGVDDFSKTIGLSMYGTLIFLALTIYILRYRKANLTRKGEMFRNVRNACYVIMSSLVGLVVFLDNVRILAVICLILFVISWILEKKIKSERV